MCKVPKPGQHVRVAVRTPRSCTVSGSAASLAKLCRMATLAVVLGMKDSLPLDLASAVVTGATGLAGHDVFHGELVVAELALFFENLVVMAIIAGRAGIDMQLVGEERVLEVLLVLLDLEDDVPTVFFSWAAADFTTIALAKPGSLSSVLSIVLTKRTATATSVTVGARYLMIFMGSPAFFFSPGGSILTAATDGFST